MNKKFYFFYFTILLAFLLILNLDIPNELLFSFLPILFIMIFSFVWITIRIYHFNIKFNLYRAWKTKMKKLTFKSKEANITLAVWLIIALDFIIPSSFFIVCGLFLTMFLPNILFTILGLVYLLLMNETYKFLNNLIYIKNWKLLNSLTRHNNKIVNGELEDGQKMLLFLFLLINNKMDMNHYFKKEYQFSFLKTINLIQWQKQGTKPPHNFVDLF